MPRYLTLLSRHAAGICPGRHQAVGRSGSSLHGLWPLFLSASASRARSAAAWAIQRATHHRTASLAHSCELMELSLG